LVKTKEAPLGETSLETLLVLLLRAWIRVNANLFSHYGVSSAGVARTRGKNQSFVVARTRGGLRISAAVARKEAGTAIGQTYK
jgi:hypothetical protein